MKRKYRCSRLLAGFLAVTAWGLCHAQFAVPAEGPVAFRRDRVPLDADTMCGLSRHLTTVARTQPAASPAARRTVAQLLALAQALDPGNADCRDLMAAWRDGTHTPLEDPESRGRSLDKIRQLAEWLKLPETSRDGQALAACLEDVVAASDPGQPPAGLRESGAWTGWIPDLEAYHPRPAVTAGKPQFDNPAPVPDASVRPTPGLSSARIGILVWKKSEERMPAEWLPAPAMLQMEASPASAPDAPFSIQILPADRWHEETARMLEKLMLGHHGNPPRGIRIRITNSDIKSPQVERRPIAFSAAAAVLASAAITGREADAIVLGDVDGTGAFSAPEAFWEQLLALGNGNGNGKRLVLPASASALLPSLLAFGKPGLFMDYEVLLARDFRHLLDLTAKKPPQAVAAASAKFQAIREHMGTEDVRSYVANRFVRPRLGELAQEADYHASAAMLFTQGSGQRPTLISRVALTAELIRACNALSWIPMTQDRNFEAWEEDQMGKTLDDYRKRLDELAAMAAKTDQDLMESARSLVQPMRDIERARRGRGEYYLKMEEMSRTRRLFSRQFQKIETSLAAEARKLAKE